jgi:hypothetical protein
MTNTRTAFFIFIICSVLCLQAQAKETNISDEYPSVYRGVRPLGMGNAFIAMDGTDSNAQFYNPASINDYDEKIVYAVGAPMAELDMGVIPMIGDLLDLKKNLQGADTSKQKIDYFKDFTKKDTGRYNHLATSMLLFQARKKNFAASMVLDDHSVISLRDKAFPNFEFKTTTTAGPVVGGALGLMDDDLKIGANVKLLFRMGIAKQITIGDILVHSLSELIGFGAWQKGFGAGVDLGMKYKLPVAKETLRPTIGITIQDLGNTYFTDDVSIMPMSISVGAGIFPKLGKVDFAIVADIREINQAINMLTKFHFGVEAQFPKVIHTKFSLRAGCNQGYPSVGASARWGLATLNLAFYGEEAGKYNYSKPDYRGAIGFNFEF